jgi:hypothetical protein
MKLSRRDWCDIGGIAAILAAVVLLVAWKQMDSVSSELCETCSAL